MGADAIGRQLQHIVMAENAFSITATGTICEFLDRTDRGELGFKFGNFNLQPCLRSHLSARSVVMFAALGDLLLDANAYPGAMSLWNGRITDQKKLWIVEM